MDDSSAYEKFVVVVKSTGRLNRKTNVNVKTRRRLSEIEMNRRGKHVGTRAVPNKFKFDS